jgi:hypothetical protein
MEEAAAFGLHRVGRRRFFMAVRQAPAKMV